MAQVVHLSDDLIFASRVAGVARDLGLSCATVRTTAALAAAAAGASCVIVDLANPGLALAEMLAALPQGRRPHVVGYGPHVETALLRAARAAGCDVVLARSQFADELPVNLTVWAADASGGPEGLDPPRA